MLRPGYFRVPWHVLDFAWRLRWWLVMFLDGGFFQCPNIKVLRFWSPGLIRIFEEIQFWWADLIEMRSFSAPTVLFKVFFGDMKAMLHQPVASCMCFFPRWLRWFAWAASPMSWLNFLPLGPQWVGWIFPSESLGSCGQNAKWWDNPRIHVSMIFFRRKVSMTIWTAVQYPKICMVSLQKVSGGFRK